MKEKDIQPQEGQSLLQLASEWLRAQMLIPLACILNLRACARAGNGLLGGVDLLKAFMLMP